MYYGFYRWRWRRRAVPKKAKGGIKPDSKRGPIGQGWLARQWMGMLEEADPGGEFTRGKAYARKGQVLYISVERGVVASRVQGSARHPYRTLIQFGLPGVNYWRRFADTLKEQPALAARILAGEMPEDVGEALSRRGLSLFRANQKITISCNCDRWSAMCKHATAVCHILAEEFDRDPFLYMKIFGIEREDLLEMMGLRAGRDTDAGPAAAGTGAPPAAGPAPRSGGSPPARPDRMARAPPAVRPAPRSGAARSPAFPVGGGSSGGEPAGDRGGEPDEPPPVWGGPPPRPSGDSSGLESGGEPAPLPGDPLAFWGRPDQADHPYSSEPVPAEDAALPKQMGNFPMWRGEERFVKVMEEIYHQASLEGVNAHLGIRDGRKHEA